MKKVFAFSSLVTSKVQGLGFEGGSGLGGLGLGSK